MAATSENPSPLKSPTSHCDDSTHVPWRMAHCSVATVEPVDRRTVSVFIPPSFQMATASDRPSPSKSPESHRTESPHFSPATDFFHRTWGENPEPVEG